MTTAKKTCFRCGASKPRTDFYRHKAMADGLLGKCKECTKADTREHRAANLDRIREYDRERAAKPERRALMKRVTGAYAASHPERRKANSAVHNAVRDGRLSKPPACWYCGRTRGVVGHHADYSRPLAVSWLCQACHKSVHVATAQLQAAA